MKYDILNDFREYLIKQIKNKNTAQKYYFSVVKIMKDKQFNSLDEIDTSFLEKELSNIKNKNDFSAAKQGLLYLKKFDNSLILPDKDFFKETSMRKRNWAKKPAKTMYLDKINRKVNALKDKKLKLAFRLMKVSGLRVSEIASLESKDIEIDQDKIRINVRHGKGGSNGIVECLNDDYLKKNLKEYLQSGPDQLFYSSSTMKKKAGELGIECHDFRRIAAITHNKKQKEQLDKTTANESTKEFLRHVRFSTTKRYLYNRKLKIKEPERKKEVEG